MSARPAEVDDEHLAYLDQLRLTGATNMFGASPWLARAFGLDDATARKIHAYWMEHFGEMSRKSPRMNVSRQEFHERNRDPD